MDFLSFCFFWTAYKATFLNRSDNTWRPLRLHILSPFPPSSALPATYFLCQMIAQTCQPTQSCTYLCRQHACSHEIVFWKILHMFCPLCLVLCVCVRARACVYVRVHVCACMHVCARARAHVCVCAHARVCARVEACARVFTASWLRIPDISFFDVHMGFCSVTFSTRVSVSAHSCACAQPPHGYIVRTFRSLLLQHIPSHTSVLFPTLTSTHACTVTIMKFLFPISENNAVHQVSRLVIPGNAGYPG
jgi:hypothetical protein